MTLAHIGDRLLHIGLGNSDLGFIGAQFFVAFEFDLRSTQGGLEAQRLAIVQVQIGDPRLRYWMQAQPLSLQSRRARDQGLDHVGLDLFRKTLANDRRRNVAAPEARNARHLLIFLDQRIGFAGDMLDRNLNLNLAFGGAFFGRVFVGRIFGLSRLTITFPKRLRQQSREGKCSAAAHYALT